MLTHKLFKSTEVWISSINPFQTAPVLIGYNTDRNCLYSVWIPKNHCFPISREVLVWAYKWENKNSFVKCSYIL